MTGRSPRAVHGLLAIEGIDGAGKSKLVEGLQRRLRKEGYRVARWKEPSTTALGRAAKFFAGQDPSQSALLFTLDRAGQRDLLERTLRRYDVVLSDRSYYSTLAYQASALGPRERSELLRLQRALARPPDRVLWLDLPPEAALARVARRGAPRFSLERLEVLSRAARAYAEFASREPRRFIRLDARRPADEVLEAACQRLGLSPKAQRDRPPARRRAPASPRPRKPKGKSHLPRR